MVGAWEIKFLFIVMQIYSWAVTSQISRSQNRKAAVYPLKLADQSRGRKYASALFCKYRFALLQPSMCLPSAESRIAEHIRKEALRKTEELPENIVMDLRSNLLHQETRLNKFSRANWKLPEKKMSFITAQEMQQAINKDGRNSWLTVTLITEGTSWTVCFL